MSFMERLAVNAGAYLIPKTVAYRLARGLLATQGIGWAGPTGGIKYSGESTFIRNHIGQLSSPIVFDVGAYVEDYAQACLEANPRISLHCFEPSVPHFSVLKRNTSGKFPNATVKLNLFGLSDTECEMLLNKESEITGMASLTVRDLAHIQVDQTIKENVILKTGDNYIEANRIDRIDLLKIDVESWEMPILQGFNGAFERKLIRTVQFEFGHAHIERRRNFRDFYRFFTALGFRIGPLKPNGDVNYLTGYDEMLENYLATNYVAVLN